MALVPLLESRTLTVASRGDVCALVLQMHLIVCICGWVGLATLWGLCCERMCL